MSYTTPTNSVLNRDESDAARVSQVIYENESLKIQVEVLQEKLQSTGLLKLENLRQENESLRGEVAKLRVQLDEKSTQLEQHMSSNDRFSNIDQSLHELLNQIQTQRTEMAGMKDLTREKDARIAELTAQLKRTEEELSEAQAQLSAASADAAQQSTQEGEVGGLREQVAQLNTELGTLRRASEEEATNLQKALTAAQTELLTLKADAAAKSVVKGQRMTSQEQEMAECREREASSQRQVVELQARIESLRAEASQLKQTQAELQRRAQEQQQQILQQQQLHQQQQQQQREAAAASSAVTAANRRVDLYCPEVKAHVERAVQNATDGMQRRLKEQVEQNASLLSRMALIQQESEAMMKSKGMSNHEVTVMKERVDLRSRRNDVRHTMQRRVAELLSSEELSKEDIELLLQEMLDYQEEQDQEGRTLLLVKDMEAEERERALRRELKRVKDENASLMKQLQHVAMEGFHRDRSSSLPGTAAVAAQGPSNAAPAASAAASPRDTETSSAAPQLYHYNNNISSSPTAVASPNNGMPEPAYQLAAERLGGGGGGGNAAGGTGQLTPPRQNQHTTSSSSPSGGLQGQSYQHQQQQFGGDLWSNPPPSRATALPPHPQYAQHPMNHVDPQPPQQGFNMSGAGAGASPESNRNVLVHCPACTFKQRYGNRNCEICDAALQLN